MSIDPEHHPSLPPASPPPPPPLSLLDLPDGPLRLVLSKLPIHDKFAASHTCHDLRRCLVTDPDPGCWGRLRIHIDGTFDHKIRFESYEYTPDTLTIKIRVRSEDPAYRAAALKWISRRAPCFSSIQLDVPDTYDLPPVPGSPHEPNSDTFVVLASLLSDIAPHVDPRVPFVICFDFPQQDRAEGPSLLTPLFEALSPIRDRALDLRLDLYFWCPPHDAEAFSLFKSIGFTALKSVAVRMFAPSFGDWSYIRHFEHLPNLSVDIFNDAQPGFWAELARLTGLESLCFCRNEPGEFPLETALALSNLTCLKIYETRTDTLPHALAFASLFPTLKSLVISGDSVALYPELFSGTAGQFPPCIQDLTLDLVSNQQRNPTWRESEGETYSFLPTAFEGLEHLTSLQIRAVWLPVSWDRAPFNARYVSFPLSDSLSCLTRLRRLRVEGLREFEGRWFPPQVRRGLRRGEATVRGRDRTGWRVERPLGLVKVVSYEAEWGAEWGALGSEEEAL